MHGVVQDRTYASRIRAVKAWERWRLAVYAPDGSWQRSAHLNGRGEDRKFPMLIDYDGSQPAGAPAPGWMDA